MTLCDETVHKMYIRHVTGRPPQPCSRTRLHMPHVRCLLRSCVPAVDFAILGGAVIVPVPIDWLVVGTASVSSAPYRVLDVLHRVEIWIHGGPRDGL